MSLTPVPWGLKGDGSVDPLLSFNGRGKTSPGEEREASGDEKVKRVARKRKKREAKEGILNLMEFQVQMWSCQLSRRNAYGRRLQYRIWKLQRAGTEMKRSYVSTEHTQHHQGLRCHKET